MNVLRYKHTDNHNRLANSSSLILKAISFCRQKNHIFFFWKSSSESIFISVDFGRTICPSFYFLSFVFSFSSLILLSAITKCLLNVFVSFVQQWTCRRILKMYSYTPIIRHLQSQSSTYWICPVLRLLCHLHTAFVHNYWNRNTARATQIDYFFDQTMSLSIKSQFIPLPLATFTRFFYQRERFVHASPATCLFLWVLWRNILRYNTYSRLEMRACEMADRWMLLI